MNEELQRLEADLKDSQDALVQAQEDLDAAQEWLQKSKEYVSQIVGMIRDLKEELPIKE